MYLQERIEELESGILYIDKNVNKVKLVGFLSPERLTDYYEKNIQCFFSKGLYDYEELKFENTKDNALFIVLEDNDELKKHQFIPLKKESIKYKIVDESNKSKTLSKTYTIRKCKFTNLYNYVDLEVSLLFKNLGELKKYFEKNYQMPLNLHE
ncbi:hypothetical protein [Clostridium beijerinckii]|uniref:Uncharacterized protein n=1 Tax=Clostridium beijerinckii TaxID=1520 RepID=A0AAE5H8F5_CLOBE|nr:hypothetical protein [Clostridium beijerinckii]NSB16793.1 hypothetical protein [Clostridium beijerinckii]OOM31400.1 hypothetical protein CLOBE_11150 [Clostridium beijerinckii]